MGDTLSLKPGDPTEPVAQREGARQQEASAALGDERYRVIASLGRGGMGEVLRAQDQRLLRDVAVKRITSEQDREALARFTAEARIGGQLDHPAVLPVYDMGLDGDGAPFFTMKLVPGHRSLVEVIEALRAGDPEAVAAFSFQRRVALIQQVCRAITYAHRRGVVHRDLKPGNLVVGGDGEVYVVDWGIAKLLEGGSGTVEVSDEVRERLLRFDEASLVGTPAYMAPETITDGTCDARTDTWALCVILYELLTLQRPFNGRNVRELVEQFREPPPRPAEGFRDDVYGRVPRSLSQILQRGLAAERRERFSDPAELERALQTWIEGASPIVCPGTLMQRVLARASYAIDQHPVGVPMLVLALLCLGLAAVVSTVVDVIWSLVSV